ncbi:hypothetical protein ACODM8_01915 [Vibrio ostreicida]|uniref:Type III secretion protein n=1 Tax=Vibrio ostreicida TaxID=526588 RepID=A0ABT8BTL1_9VIBR|nr:hypothetical protein [Vibrio ostreicida]MDN3610029.1 hypothetical protein [Vibrio ostreicida]NPD10454.1 hypothetical protein [Vibrio ostreicida]
MATLSDDETKILKQLLQLRKRREERVQAQWNLANEQQNQCRLEQQSAYQQWIKCREVLAQISQPQQALDRDELNSLLSERRSDYVDEREKANLVEQWQQRIEQLEQQKSTLLSQKTQLVRGQEKLKEALNG